MSRDLFIAKTVHHVNNKICELNKEEARSWDDLPEYMREGLVDAVKTNLSPEKGHEAWMANRLANGWVFGETKDIEKKTSPCLLPYDQLPYEQRIKDSVRLGIVEFLNEHLDGYLEDREHELELIEAWAKEIITGTMPVGVEDLAKGVGVDVDGLYLIVDVEPDTLYTVFTTPIGTGRCLAIPMKKYKVENAISIVRMLKRDCYNIYVHDKSSEGFALLGAYKEVKLV